MGLISAFLSGCGGGASLVKDMDASLAQVPGVVSVKTEYNNNAGMSKRINVRLTVSPDAALKTVLDDSLHAFAGASGSTKGTVSVAYYVFTEGVEENGIRPDSLGLSTTPTVDEIRQYANSHQ
ncbi:hypothetical protein ACX80E_08535 [Arthrobacter sp. TMN-49]